MSERRETTPTFPADRLLTQLDALLARLAEPERPR